MGSHYEIIVSKNGRHLFATAERSATCEGTARALLAEITKRFPESEGFQVNCYYWECVGRNCVFTP